MSADIVCCEKVPDGVSYRPLNVPGFLCIVGIKLASLAWHLCPSNCCWRLAWASTVLLRALIGALNSRLQSVQSAVTGVELSHLVILRLRFLGAPLIFNRQTEFSGRTRTARLPSLWNLVSSGFSTVVRNSSRVFRDMRVKITVDTKRERLLAHPKQRFGTHGAAIGTHLCANLRGSSSFRSPVHRPPRGDG